MSLRAVVVSDSSIGDGENGEIAYTVCGTQGVDNTPVIYKIRRWFCRDWEPSMGKVAMKDVEKKEREHKLTIGDIISFDLNDDDGQTIDDYELIGHLTTNNAGQIATECVFLKTFEGEPRCWTLYFGQIVVRKHDMAHYIENVNYECWVTVDTKGARPLVAFCGFKCVLLDQGRLFQGQEESSTAVCAEDDDDVRFFDDPMIPCEGGVFRRSEHCDLFFAADNDVIKNASGMMLDNRSVFVYELRNKKVLVGHLSALDQFRGGQYVRLGMVRNDRLDIFVAMECRPMRNARFAPCSVDDMGKVKFNVTVQARENLPFGYFRCVSGDRIGICGIVADSMNLITPFLQTARTRPSFNVSVVDRELSLFCRFSIVKVDDAVVNAAHREYVSVQSSGIVIDNGHVFDSSKPTFVIKFDDERSKPSQWKLLKPGWKVSFHAEMRPNREFIIVEWDVDRTAADIDTIPVPDGHAFRTTCKWNKELCVLMSPEFSCVGDPHNVVSLNRKDSGEEVDVWVVRTNTLNTPFVTHALYKKVNSDSDAGSSGDAKGDDKVEGVRSKFKFFSINEQ